MTALERTRNWVGERPRTVTGVVSVLGYLVVGASFAGVIPFPRLSVATVNLFSDLIAVINTVALGTLLFGVAMIERGRVEAHRRAMVTAFVLIIGFLVLYVWKQAGGFTKGILIHEGQFLAQYAATIKTLYLVLLGVHILLSVLAVPFVLHAIVLGLTQPIDRLGETLHPKVGTVAVATWATSLFLGIVTYWMLNHVYSWEHVEAAALPLLVGVRLGGRQE
ncbi:MAG: DUF420 domain-containing protein [Halanaeroarchaeum sp.]